MRSLDRRAATTAGRKLRPAAILAALAGIAVALAGVEQAQAAGGTATAPASAEPAAAGHPDAPDAGPHAAARPRIRAAGVDRSRIILGARRGIAFRFELAGRRPRKMLVKVARAGSDQVHKRFRLGRVRPGERQRVRWDGKTGKRGYIPPGKYAFRVYSDGKRAEHRRRDGATRFGFYENRFPILGRHRYGDGFGAGRDHQGQDLFARCGRPVVAAHAGRVQTRRYHSAAGYYVVVDGRGTGRDYAYMHMSRRGRPKQGSRVAAGERIGTVNDTGRASGCHLHFEIWTKPGWYEGGRAKSPTRALRRWDGWS